MMKNQRNLIWISSVLLLWSLKYVDGDTIYHHLKVNYQIVNRLCKNKTIVTVNGQYPGPTLYAHEGDKIVIKVTNFVPENVTIHWHGIRQIDSNWYDGVAQITQCPIQTGESFTYRYTITGQRGTAFYHAHVALLRATVHGAFVIYPPKSVPYPFPNPHKEHIILMGEWWNLDVDYIANHAAISQDTKIPHSAFTINGQPGDLYPCSAQDAYSLHVHLGKTYLLRLVSTAIVEQLYFKIENHTLTIVEKDGAYTKHVTLDYIILAPGETMNVLFTANQLPNKYYMVAKPNFLALRSLISHKHAIGTIQYIGASNESVSSETFLGLPAINSTSSLVHFAMKLRSLASQAYPTNVPQTVDKHLVFVISFNLDRCPNGATCKYVPGLKLATSINNITFRPPEHTSILQAYYDHINGTYTTSFPDHPSQQYNYTESPQLLDPFPHNTGTEVNVLPYGSHVQLILQGTTVLESDIHPIHLHGHNFYVVGHGKGVYQSPDSSNFNLIDPPIMNTVSVLPAGWVAIRFTADNPGVWALHCHLDLHMIWGMQTTFLVSNGVAENQKLRPPPSDLPICR